MVRAGLIDINQHANKWCCAEEKSSKVCGFKLHISIDNTSPHFSFYSHNPSILELRTFGCDIYPIKSSPKKLDGRTKEGSFMGYTNSRATMKWWDPRTKKIKHFSSAKFDEHNNKFGKG